MAGTFDILGARLIDGTGAKPRDMMNLRIDKGAITAIWQGQDRPPTAQAPADRALDAAGKTIMPGLIDAHCHMSYGEAASPEEADIHGGPEWSAVRAVYDCQKVLRAGVTSIIDPGSTYFVAVTARDAIANGMFPGPCIYAAGRHISADDGFIDYFPSWLGIPDSAEGVLCPTKEEIVREVRRQVKNRVDMIKIGGDSHAQESFPEAGPCFSDEEMKAIVTAANQLGRKTAIHARYAETVVAAARAKVDWIYHVSYTRTQDLGFIRDSGAALCPTLTAPGNMVSWEREMGLEQRVIDHRRAELDASGEIHGRAHRMGIPILAGSETGFAMTPYGEWHARELELMVDIVGLSPMEAILTMTRNVAAAIGWDDVGTLEVGRRADLIVIDGDPLADIRILGDARKIGAVFKESIEIDRTTEIPPRRRLAHERSYRNYGTPLTRNSVDVAGTYNGCPRSPRHPPRRVGRRP